jgi:hypothetical protein
VLTTPSRENIHVIKYSQYEMLPLEIKQSGGKLLPHSVLRGECFQREYLEVFKSGKGTFCQVHGMLGPCIGQVHLRQQPGN